VPQSERGLYADEQGERHYEAFDLALDLPQDDPDYLSSNKLLGPNVWPQLQGFQETISRYYNAVAELGTLLCGAFEMHLRLKPGHLQQYMTKPTSQLRLLHYLENKAAKTADDMNMGAHTDYECFTILHQRQAGLQVLNSNNQWLDAPVVKGGYAINIGDMLETWTNGAFRATPHRVINSGKERFSMPFFVAANFDATIEPLQTPSTKQRPTRYRKIVAGHHLLGQLIRDFSYLRQRYEAGQLKLPFAVPTANPFENRIQALQGMH